MAGYAVQRATIHLVMPWHRICANKLLNHHKPDAPLPSTKKSHCL